MKDGGLIKRARRGDISAFAEAFSEVEEEIYRVAFLYVKNRDDALDIVQETALSCFQNAKKLREAKYFKTWAVRIAINRSLDFLRKSGRTLPLGEDLSGVPAAGGDEAEAIARITLEDLLNRLDEAEKSVILLKYHCGYTFSEIAKMLKIPPGTAKSVCYRAISKLRKEKGGEL